MHPDDPTTIPTATLRPPRGQLFDRVCAHLEEHGELTAPQGAALFAVGIPAVRELAPRLQTRYGARFHAAIDGRGPKGRPCLRFRLALGATDDDRRRQAQERVLALSFVAAMCPVLMKSTLGDAIDADLNDALTDADLAGVDVSRKVWSQASALCAGAVDADVLDVVATGLWRAKLIRFDYTNNRAESHKVTVAPLSFMVTDAGLHLYGECLEGWSEWLKLRRTWALARVSNALVCQETVAAPSQAAFDPHLELDPAFTHFVRRDGEPDAVNVTVIFAPSMAVYLKSAVLHRSQRVDDMVHNGQPAVRVRLHVFPQFDLVHWIRGYGNAVLDVQPAWIWAWVRGGEGPKVLQREPSE